MIACTIDRLLPRRSIFSSLSLFLSTRSGVGRPCLRSNQRTNERTNEHLRLGRRRTRRRRSTTARNDTKNNVEGPTSPLPRSRIRGRGTPLLSYRIIPLPRPAPDLHRGFALTATSIRFINISLGQTFGSGGSDLPRG